MERKRLIDINQNPNDLENGRAISNVTTPVDDTQEIRPTNFTGEQNLDQLLDAFAQRDHTDHEDPEVDSEELTLTASK